MKKPVLLFLLCLFLFLFAYSQENSGAYNRYSLKSLPTIAEGKDKVWDFSAISITPVPYGGKLKVKTEMEDGVFRIDCFDGRTASYGFLQDNALYQSRVERLDLKILYDKSNKIVQFPLIYNFDFENNFAGTKIDKSSKTDSFSLRETVKIIGIGKLILPNGIDVKKAYLLKNNQQNFSFYADAVLLPLIEIIDGKAFFNDIDIENFQEELIKMPSLGDFSDDLAENIYVYPNPVSTDLYIVQKTESKAQIVEIYDLSGKLQFSTTLHNIAQCSTKTIDVSLLPSGSYLLKIGNYQHKFVKQ
jgi:hypothetical protein